MEKKITICSPNIADGYIEIKDLQIGEEINIYCDDGFNFGNQENAKKSGYKKR